LGWKPQFTDEKEAINLEKDENKKHIYPINMADVLCE